MSRHDTRRKGRRRRLDDEDVNPMNYVSNLSDVMLILATGIMLALIIHWQIDVDATSSEETTQTEEEGSVDVTTTFTDDDLENSQDVPDSLEKLGAVYYDAETGTYYIIDGDGSEDAIDATTVETTGE
jgi:hypothetical protein